MAAGSVWPSSATALNATLTQRLAILFSYTQRCVAGSVWPSPAATLDVLCEHIFTLAPTVCTVLTMK